MKKVATIILNRNLPKLTDKLYTNLKKNNKISDFYVLEAGSDYKKLSKNVTWHVKTKIVRKNGMRFARGMNQALSNLFYENKFDYDAFFLITNDTTFEKYNVIDKLYNVMKKHPKVGILSPCARTWGEFKLLKKTKTMYFPFIHNNAYFLRKNFIKQIMNQKKPNKLNFLFDGTNFRGFGVESEIIAKAYSNDWAAAITSSVICGHQERYLLKNFEEIKTEDYETNLKLYIDEGLKWMKNKYGFSNKWAMHMYVKNFYDKFFQYNPELKKFKI